MTHPHANARQLSLPPTATSWQVSRVKFVKLFRVVTLNGKSKRSQEKTDEHLLFLAKPVAGAFLPDAQDHAQILPDVVVFRAPD